MEIEVNGEIREIEGGERSVDELLDALGIEARDGLAVAVGDRVVPGGEWSERTVGDGDRVEIIRATQGG